MRIELYQLVIYRHDTPANRGTDGHIKKITKKVIGSLFTDIPPQLDEVIRYDGKDFRIDKIIRIADSNTPVYVESFVAEVAPYSTTRIKNWGSDAWSEKIPLCLDVKTKE